MQRNTIQPQLFDITDLLKDVGLEPSEPFLFLVWEKADAGNLREVMYRVVNKNGFINAKDFIVTTKFDDITGIIIPQRCFSLYQQKLNSRDRAILKTMSAVKLTTDSAEGKAFKQEFTKKDAYGRDTEHTRNTKRAITNFKTMGLASNPASTSEKTTASKSKQNSPSQITTAPITPVMMNAKSQSLDDIEYQCYSLNESLQNNGFTLGHHEELVIVRTSHVFGTNNLIADLLKDERIRELIGPQKLTDYVKTDNMNYVILPRKFFDLHLQRTTNQSFLMYGVRKQNEEATRRIYDLIESNVVFNGLVTMLNRKLTQFPLLTPAPKVEITAYQSNPVNQQTFIADSNKPQTISIPAPLQVQQQVQAQTITSKPLPTVKFVTNPPEQWRYPQLATRPIAAQVPNQNIVMTMSGRNDITLPHLHQVDPSQTTRMVAGQLQEQSSTKKDKPNKAPKGQTVYHTYFINDICAEHGLRSSQSMVFIQAEKKEEIMQLADTMGKTAAVKKALSGTKLSHYTRTIRGLPYMVLSQNLYEIYAESTTNKSIKAPIMFPTPEIKKAVTSLIQREGDYLLAPPFEPKDPLQLNVGTTPMQSNTPSLGGESTVVTSQTTQSNIPEMQRENVPTSFSDMLNSENFEIFDPEVLSMIEVLDSPLQLMGEVNAGVSKTSVDQMVIEESKVTESKKEIVEERSEQDIEMNREEPIPEKPSMLGGTAIDPITIDDSPQPNRKKEVSEESVALSVGKRKHPANDEISADRKSQNKKVRKKAEKEEISQQTEETKQAEAPEKVYYRTAVYNGTRTYEVGHIPHNQLTRIAEMEVKNSATINTPECIEDPLLDELNSKSFVHQGGNEAHPELFMPTVKRLMLFSKSNDSSFNETHSKVMQTAEEKKSAFVQQLPQADSVKPLPAGFSIEVKEKDIKKQKQFKALLEQFQFSKTADKQEMQKAKVLFEKAMLAFKDQKYQLAINKLIEALRICKNLKKVDLTNASIHQPNILLCAKYLEYFVKLHSDEKRQILNQSNAQQRPADEKHEYDADRKIEPVAAMIWDDMELAAGSKNASKVNGYVRDEEKLTNTFCNFYQAPKNRRDIVTDPIDLIANVSAHILSENLDDDASEAYLETLSQHVNRSI